MRRNPGTEMENQMTKTTKKKSKKAKNKALILAIEIIVLLILSLVLFVTIKLSKINKDRTSMEGVETNDDISAESQALMDDYTTIALFGLDNRSNGDLSSGRSDVIMLATINNKTKSVDLVSVYRDTYLDVGSSTFRKCNEGYAKGGPTQAVTMLNKNLDLDIKDYVTVDFNAIIECVDLLGGVEITITDDEASLMKGYMDELNELTGNSSQYLSSGGTYTLDGVQACAYARIRYGGGDDYRRTERQRTVISAMVTKAKQSNILTLNKVINAMFADIQTSFSNTELLSLAASLFSYDIGESTGFPFKKATIKLSSAGDVVVPCDLTTNVTQLHELLYGDTGYTPSSTVKTNSAQITTDTGFTVNDGY